MCFVGEGEASLQRLQDLVNDLIGRLMERHRKGANGTLSQCSLASLAATRVDLAAAFSHAAAAP